MDKVDLIENEEYGYCSLIKATKNVLDKLKIENITLTKVTSTTRIEKNLVDPVALREAVINAIVHNDFTREIPPVFEIFSDRITITSYGGLIPGQSVDDFFSCSSMPRNRELMRVFKDVGLVEQLGSGMSRILKAYHKDIFPSSFIRRSCRDATHGVVQPFRAFCRLRLRLPLASAGSQHHPCLHCSFRSVFGIQDESIPFLSFLWADRS